MITSFFNLISDSQCARLREAFDTNPYLSRDDRANLAKALDITEDNVTVSYCIKCRFFSGQGVTYFWILVPMGVCRNSLGFSCPDAQPKR